MIAPCLYFFKPFRGDISHRRHKTSFGRPHWSVKFIVIRAPGPVHFSLGFPPNPHPRLSPWTGPFLFCGALGARRNRRLRAFPDGTQNPCSRQIGVNTPPFGRPESQATFLSLASPGCLIGRSPPEPPTPADCRQPGGAFPPNFAPLVSRHSSSKAQRAGSPSRPFVFASVAAIRYRSRASVKRERNRHGEERREDTRYEDGRDEDD